jgi:hypothetical protein
LLLTNDAGAVTVTVPLAKPSYTSSRQYFKEVKFSGLAAHAKGAHPMTRARAKTIAQKFLK